MRRSAELHHFRIRFDAQQRGAAKRGVAGEPLHNLQVSHSARGLTGTPSAQSGPPPFALSLSKGWRAGVQNLPSRDCLSGRFAALPLQCQMAAAALLLFATVGHAQETCGVTFAVLKDGFEAGAMPAYSPPSATTPLALSVTYPTEGAILGGEMIVVAGSFSGPPNVGISVNGQAAVTTNTGFVSRPLRLMPGANSISVQLHSIDGLGPSVTRNVTFDAATSASVRLDPIDVTTAIPGSVRAVIALRSGEPLTLTRVRLDFDGDGAFDVDTETAGQVSFDYRLPGLYTITGVATLDDGDPNTPLLELPLTLPALAEHPQQHRFALCSLYGTLRSRLVAQNIASALNVLAEPLRPGFQSLWTALGAQLPSVAAQLGTIVDGTFSSQISEYIIARPIPGQPGQSMAYRVQFEREQNGVWRISAR